MGKLKFFVLFSTDGKPREFSTSNHDHQSDHDSNRGQHEFQVSVPLPLPEFLLIFAVGSWPHDDACWNMCAQIHLGKDLDPFNIGTLTKDNRSVCWQGVWREDLLVRGVLMSDEGLPGLLIVAPTSSKPAAPALNWSVINSQEPTDFKCSPVKSTARGIIDPTDDVETMEISQTESQLMDSVPYHKDIGDEITDVIRLNGCSMAADKETPSRSARRRMKAEVTPQVAVQLSTPPVLSHSIRKKRKSAGDHSTPRGQTRVKRLQMQPSSQNIRKDSSSLGSQAPARINTDGLVPSPRWGHSMCAISKKQAVVIGGQGDQQVLSKDSVWLLDSDIMSWCVPGISQTDSIKPQYRMGHTAVYDPQVKCVYVYGGSKNLRWYNDVHVLDVESWRWSLVKASGRAPTRAYHTSNLYHDEMYVFGGVYPNPDPEPDGCSDQLHVFNPASESWYEPVVMGKKPQARSGHSATLLGDKLVIFGGWDAPECFNDMHCLDLGLMEFTSIPAKGKPPSPRSWHASAALMGNRILIQGGFDGENAMKDAFVFRLDSQCWTGLFWPIAVTPTAGHTILAIHPRDSLVSDDSDDNDKENETTADAHRQQRLFIFGGGNNEGDFSNKLITFKLQLPSD